MTGKRRATEVRLIYDKVWHGRNKVKSQHNPHPSRSRADPIRDTDATCALCGHLDDLFHRLKRCPNPHLCDLRRTLHTSHHTSLFHLQSSHPHWSTLINWISTHVWSTQPSFDDDRLWVGIFNIPWALSTLPLPSTISPDTRLQIRRIISKCLQPILEGAFKIHKAYLQLASEHSRCLTSQPRSDIPSSHLSTPLPDLGLSLSPLCSVPDPPLVFPRLPRKPPFLFAN